MFQEPLKESTRGLCEEANPNNPEDENTKPFAIPTQIASLILSDINLQSLLLALLR